MGIINATPVQTGLVGVLPSLAYIETNDTIAEVTATGYLNHEVANGLQLSLPCMAAVSTRATPTTAPVVGWYQVAHVGANWSLTAPAASGVTLPTIVGHMAIYNSVTGGLGEDAATAINGGNIQAGLSGTAGTLASFPATAASGSLRLVAVANPSNRTVTITNAAQSQASAVYTLPDTQVAAADFIMSEMSGGTQTIASGNLTLTAGTLQITSGDFKVLDGGVVVGDVGTVSGLVQLNASGATGGTLILQAADNTNSSDVTIANAAHAQSTDYTIPDLGAATGGIMVSTSPIIVRSVAGAAAAGGAAAQSFTDAFCTSASNVIGNWNTQANPASVLQIVPGNGSFIVTSSADAGVGTFNYMITKA